jgi:hypothetical protein
MTLVPILAIQGGGTPKIAAVRAPFAFQRGEPIHLCVFLRVSQFGSKSRVLESVELVLRAAL